MLRLFILLFAIGLACCAETRSQSNPAQIGEEIVLKMGSTADWEPKIRIRFVAVTEDSRCAAGSTCVWAGQLKISVSVTQDGKESIHEVIDSEQLTIGEYRLQLVRAEPTPRPDRKIPSQEYRVTLRLVRT